MMGKYVCFHSFPVVDWFCLFIYLWVLTFPLYDCSEFGNFVIILIYIYCVLMKVLYISKQISNSIIRLLLFCCAFRNSHKWFSKLFSFNFSSTSFIVIVHNIFYPHITVSIIMLGQYLSWVLWIRLRNSYFVDNLYIKEVLIFVTQNKLDQIVLKVWQYSVSFKALKI
jgi:hypothetical protein